MMAKLFRSVIVCIILVSFSSAVPSAFAKTIELKIAHANVPDHPMGVGFEKFKERVESLTKGAIKVKIFDSGKLGGINEMMSAIQTHSLQIASIPTPYLVNYNKKFSIFDMPFMFPDYESTDKITDGPVGRRLATVFENRGLKGLGYIEIGFRNVFNNKRPIEKIEDAKGLKIRATGSKSHIATLQSFGLMATSVAWGEVYTAMQQKTVDGIDMDIHLAAFNNFDEVTKYVTLTGALYTPHLVFINDKFLKGLSKENQKIVLDSFDEMKVFERSLNRSLEKEGLEKLKKKGLMVTTLSPAEKQKWIDASKVVYKKFEKNIGKDLLLEVKNTLKQ